MQKFCKEGANFGYFKKRGGAAASSVGGALEDKNNLVILRVGLNAAPPPKCTPDM